MQYARYICDSIQSACARLCVTIFFTLNFTSLPANLMQEVTAFIPAALGVRCRLQKTSTVLSGHPLVHTVNQCAFWGSWMICTTPFVEAAIDESPRVSRRVLNRPYADGNWRCSMIWAAFITVSVSHCSGRNRSTLSCSYSLGLWTPNGCRFYRWVRTHNGCLRQVCTHALSYMM